MRIRSNRWMALMAIAGLALAAGCSDDDNPGDNNNTVQQDATVDATPDAAITGVSIEVVFYDGDQPIDAPNIPLEGVTFAVDLPGGERVEYTSDANGRVTVEGVDWSLGTMNGHAYLPGRTITSVLGTTEALVNEAIAESDSGMLEWYLYTQSMLEPTPTWASIDGAHTNVHDTAHSCIVHVARAQAEDRWEGACTDTYSVAVEEATELTLVGVELSSGAAPGTLGYALNIHRVMHLDVDPLLDATTIELDHEAWEAPLFTADASVVRSYRAESPLNNEPLYVFNFANDTNHAIGWASHSNVNAAGDYFDVSHIWSEPLGVDTPFTMYRFVVGNYDQYSVAQLEGYPQGGVIDGPFDLPAWITPSNPAMAHPLHDTFEVEIFDDVERRMLGLLRNVGGRWEEVQRIHLHDESPRLSFTIPEPPSTVDPTALYGTSTLFGQFFIGSPNAELTRWERYAVPTLVLVTP